MRDFDFGKIGLTFRREGWDANYPFEAFTGVVVNGEMYVSLIDNTGVNPTTDTTQTTWLKVTERGESLYQMMVRTGKFAGTEEEFLEEYRATLQAAVGAASNANAAAESAATTEHSLEVAEALRSQAESQRALAENQRNAAEGARVNAETSRAAAEASRNSAETARQAGHEQAMEETEVAMQQAGSDHTQAVSDHSTAQSDHTQAGSDHTQAASDHSTAQSDHTQAGSDHTQAASDHSTAQSDHTQAGSDHTQAESDHSTAQSDHTQAGSDHTQAASDHSTAQSDHTQAGSDHARAENDHTASAAATAAATEAAAEADSAREAIQDDLSAKANKDGYYQTLSAGYADKAGDIDIHTSTMVHHTQVKAMDTTGGDKDVKDGVGFVRVVRGTENGITAAGSKIISFGFNLIPSGSGTTFTFRCVKGEWGAYGTSEKNNGYLFTGSQGNIITPASVLQNGVAVPTHTDHGKTYYLPPQDGQCTVVFATSQTNPCAHICWSNGRDAEYEAYNASQVDLSNAITAIGGTLRRVGYVYDEINLDTKQSIRRLGYRLLNALSWTVEVGPTPEEGEATNTFRAIVSGGVATADTIKAGGAFAIKGVSGMTFSLDGTSLVCDSTIASVADFVTALGSGAIEYELTVPVVVANTLNGEITISDYGIILFENTAGATVVDIDFDFNQKWADFIKNLPNDLEQMANDRNSIRDNVDSIAEDVRSLGDVASLPLLCGQPQVLFGAGAPAEAVVPDNWKQFDPATGEGYNWNGNPSAIGQRYINVSAANGGYTAGRKSLDKASADYYVLKWYKD